MGITNSIRVRKKLKMKLSSTILFGVAAANIETLYENEDKKVPPRHPLQRLWRLYQFSEEIIQEHIQNSPGLVNRPKKVQRYRNRIGKWQYLAARQSFMRNTKKCGFYDSDEFPHGGPEGTNEAPGDMVGPEQSLSQASENVASLEVYNPRPNRRSVDDDDEDLRYNRAEPCHGIRQIQSGFKKWAHRYIGNCGGQKQYEHQEKRADKLYEHFTGFLECNHVRPLWKPSS